MDPFELMYRRPVPVKSTSTKADFDFDEGLIDRVLGRPNKIDIPERYIPEREQLAPEEEQKRSEKAEAICRLLSKSNSAGPIPLVLPHPSRHHQNHHLQNHPNQHHQNHPNQHHQNHPNHHPSQHHQNHPIQHHQNHPNHHHQNHPNQYLQHRQSLPNHHQNHLSYGSSRSIHSGTSASESLGVNSHILPSASPNRRPLSSSLKKASSSSRINNRTPTRNSSTCDWSLAGVSAPTSPHPASNLSRNSYYSSSTSASSLYAPTPTSGLGGTKPSHSYHSSYSSTSSGRSSSDREELLHLQHNIAREVTEKSRLVAVRALASSPSPNPYRYSGGSRYRDPSPPSPIDLPTIQQREGFFT